MRQQRSVARVVKCLNTNDRLQQVLVVQLDVLVELVLGAGRADDEDCSCIFDIRRNLFQICMTDRYMAAAARVGLVVQVRGRVLVPNDVMRGL